MDETSKIQIQLYVFWLVVCVIKGILLVDALVRGGWTPFVAGALAIILYLTILLIGWWTFDWMVVMLISRR